MTNQGSTGRFTACTSVETIVLDHEDEQLWLLTRTACRTYTEALFMVTLQYWIDGVLLGEHGPTLVKGYDGRMSVEFNGGRVTQCDGKVLRIVRQGTIAVGDNT